MDFFLPSHTLPDCVVRDRILYELSFRGGRVGRVNICPFLLAAHFDTSVDKFISCHRALETTVELAQGEKSIWIDRVIEWLGITIKGILLYPKSYCRQTQKLLHAANATSLGTQTPQMKERTCKA